MSDEQQDEPFFAPREHDKSDKAILQVDIGLAISGLIQSIERLGRSRELSLARTKLEEAQHWLSAYKV